MINSVSPSVAVMVNPPNEVLPESLVIQAFGRSLSTCESR